jgi:hypothetical protein
MVAPVSPSIYNYSVLKATVAFGGTALGNVRKSNSVPRTRTSTTSVRKPD